MEEWQRKHIQKNLVELVKATICNAHLITRFAATEVLSGADVESLELIHLTPFEKSKKLYEILKTRVGAFEILLKSLQETGQTGAIKILKNHKPIFRSYGRISFDRNHVLGTGSSGTKVFQGKLEGRDVAVKVINSDLIDDPEQALREVELMEKVDDHENILRYFSAESEDNLIFIALELCVISLQDEIKLNMIQMNPIDILRKCTKGLVHLHKHKIIHRDMKPANILFTVNKQVKISDFGVSKQIPLGMTSVTLQAGVGTADWMAPEVIQFLIEGTGAGRIRMSTSADIFSLGCIFVFTLTNGSHPFGDPLARQQNIYKNKPELETLKIENDWLKLVKTMLSHVPTSRPSSEEVLTSECFRFNDTLGKKNQASPTTSAVQPTEKPIISNEQNVVSREDVNSSQLSAVRTDTDDDTESKIRQSPSEKPQSKVHTTQDDRHTMEHTFEGSSTKRDEYSTTQVNKSNSTTMDENMHRWNIGENELQKTGIDYNLDASRKQCKRSSLNLSEPGYATYDEELLQDIKMKNISEMVVTAMETLKTELSNRFPFTPDPGTNIPANVVFYENGHLQLEIEGITRDVRDKFLKQFSGEGAEAMPGLRDTIDSALEPIAFEYTEKNEENHRRAETTATTSINELKEDYISQMQIKLKRLPTMDAETLALFHETELENIIQKFQSLNFGTPSYKTKWLDQLQVEIAEEHEYMSLRFETTMAKALQMVKAAVEAYKKILEEKSEELESEHEIRDFHDEHFEGVIRKFKLNCPFTADSKTGEMFIENLMIELKGIFAKVVDERALRKRKMEEQLETNRKLDEQLEIYRNSDEYLKTYRNDSSPFEFP